MSAFTVKVFRQEAKFIAGAANASQLPKLMLPQIAFVGKSNVGKSSLINKLCNRRALARVSHTPGRTQQINFFSIGEKFLLADLPGYGYAKVSANQRQNWEKLIVTYLTNSQKLVMINVLVDSRRGLQKNDLAVLELLKNHDRNFQIILTKADKIRDIASLMSQTREQLLEHNLGCDVLSVSSHSGAGSKELQMNIVECIASF